jgi:D-serine deaminase-like pyridoxal phosphate-dependent protein
MNGSPVGERIDQLETPVLLVDLDALEFNSALMAETICGGGKQWRPHAKSFKTPAIAHMLLRAGAVGLTVAKVSEAEVFAACGVRDILIAHLVVGEKKAARLAALQRQALVRATVDHADQLPALSAAARAAGVTIGLLVDIDIGLERTGVRSVASALELGRVITSVPGLRLDGLMGYEGHTLYLEDPDEKRRSIERAVGILTEAKGALERAGLPCPIVSAGGSGSYQITAKLPTVTELQAGGGIFGCAYYSDTCQVKGHQVAISVLASVVSVPTPGRLVLDAGLKALSNFRGEPRLRSLDSGRIVGLSAEHATLDHQSSSPVPIGKKLEIVPGYSDLTFVLHNEVVAHRSGVVEAIWPLLARGAIE